VKEGKKVRDMLVEAVYWSPRWGVCGAGRPRATATTVEEGYQSDAPQPPPWPVQRPTLIIWYREDCVACKLNKGVFARLEEHPRSRSGLDFAVVRVQATNEQMKRFPHVVALPTFDLVHVTPGASSPYGPGTALRSIPNNARAPLESEFPVAFTGLPPDQRALTTTR
jgi:hypothetical protein